MNNNIILIFKKLIDHNQTEYLKNKDNCLRFKVIQFTKVVKILTEYPKNIESGEQLRDIKGIGKGIINRIDEIINTGTLSEIPKSDSLDQEILEINDLLRVTGIGPSNAKKMVSNNITLDKLLNNTEYLNDLNHHQQIGIKYFSDFETSIPRKEISSLEKKISKRIEKLGFKIYICGSYRRKKLVSGDIDILIIHDNIIRSTDINEKPLEKVINILTKEGIIIDHLTNNGNTKYMGVCRNSPKGLARRIDIRLIPQESISCALLYFTGSGGFNVNMRAYALKKGYTINEYFIKQKPNNNIIMVESEEEIFEILGLKYIEPENRTINIIFN